MVLRMVVGLLASAGVLVAADSPAPVKVGGLNFTAPAGWEAGQAGGMRKAQFKIKGEKDASGEVIFFEFPAGQGGGITPNVNRWLAQFEEPKEKINSKVETKEVSGTKITYVSAEGTYKSGMPGGPTTPLPNRALRGAILEGPEGNVFIRMVVPKELVKTAEPEFQKMVEAAVKK